jgi:hypothetical protein
MGTNVNRTQQIKYAARQIVMKNYDSSANRRVWQQQVYKDTPLFFISRLVEASVASTACNQGCPTFARMSEALRAVVTCIKFGPVTLWYTSTFITGVNRY